MRIIEEGVLPPKPVLRGRCSHCNCLIEVEADEVSVKTIEDGYKIETKAFQCPTVGCHKAILLRPYYL